MLVGQLFGFLKLTGKNQLAHLGEVFDRFGIVVVMGPSGPETGLVEGDAFLLGTAENHSAHQAIAQGRRFEPLLRRLPIP